MCYIPAYFITSKLITKYVGKKRIASETLLCYSLITTKNKNKGVTCYEYYNTNYEV